MCLDGYGFVGYGIWKEGVCWFYDVGVWFGFGFCSAGNFLIYGIWYFVLSGWVTGVTGYCYGLLGRIMDGLIGYDGYIFRVFLLCICWVLLCFHTLPLARGCVEVTPKAGVG